MKMKTRFLSAMVASSLLAIGAIHAECHDPCNPCPVDPCCAPCNPCPVDPCCDPCDPCYDPCMPESCCWTGFEIGADFIYWKPCIDDLDYAALYDTVVGTNGSSTGVKTASYKYVNPDWEPGFRVNVGIDDLWCDWGLLGSYTWIKSCNSAKTTDPGTFLEATMTHTHNTLGPSQIVTVAFATLKQELTYQDFDALFATDYCFRRCHNFKPFFGVTGVFLDQDLKSTWQQDQGNNSMEDGTTTWDSCFSGVGLRFGSQYSFSICEGFQLFGAASGAITVGDNKSEVRFKKDVTGGETTTSADYGYKDGECIFVPGYHIQIGFTYDACWCGSDIGLRFGYEFLQWHNVPNIRRFLAEGPPETALSTSPTTSTLGFHGIFAGIGVSF